MMRKYLIQNNFLETKYVRIIKNIFRGPIIITLILFREYFQSCKFIYLFMKLAFSGEFMQPSYYTLEMSKASIYEKDWS